MIQLSMIDANDFVQSVTLDDTAYKLHYSWNDYAKQWTVDVRDSQNADIVRGIAVVPNYPLFMQHHRNPLMPKGELLAVVVDGKEPLRRKSFVTGAYSIVYIPESEINAIRNAK